MLHWIALLWLAAPIHAAEDKSLVEEKTGDVREASGKIESGDKSAARLKLADGTVVYVASNTIVLIKPTDAGAPPEIEQQEGTVRVVVRSAKQSIRKSMKERPVKFLLRTRSSVLAVRGTDFVVTALKGADATAHTLEGVVDVAENEAAFTAGKTTAVGASKTLAFSEKGLGEVAAFDPKAFLSELAAKEPQLMALAKGGAAAAAASTAPPAAPAAEKSKSEEKTKEPVEPKKQPEEKSEKPEKSAKAEKAEETAPSNDDLTPDVDENAKGKYYHRQKGEGGCTWGCPTLFAFQVSALSAGGPQPKPLVPEIAWTPHIGLLGDFGIRFFGGVGVGSTSFFSAGAMLTYRFLILEVQAGLHVMTAWSGVWQGGTEATPTVGIAIPLPAMLDRLVLTVGTNNGTRLKSPFATFNAPTELVVRLGVAISLPSVLGRL